MEHYKNNMLIVDSMALLFRGFYATYGFGQVMQTKDGTYTNALYQYTKYLMDAVKKFQPSHIVCAMDMGKKTFRNELYPLYKANRGEPPVELIPQFSLLKELIEAFDIPLIGVEGYEADDVIGTLASQHASEETQVMILTGDGDSLQLLERHVKVIMMKKGFGNYEEMTLENLAEKKGLAHPKQVIELKGLMGDASDNIPGCPNVGAKTAEKLLQEYGSIDGVFASLDSMKGKLKERLTENQELIYLSRRLATIDTDVPVQLRLEDCCLRFNREKIQSTFDRFEFRSLAKLLA